MSKATTKRRNSLHMTIFMAILATMMLAGCKPQVPSEYIQPDDMADILYDYYISKALATQGDSTEYNRNLYYLDVLRKHSVTESEFDSSLVYYYSHAERLAKIYETVSKRMQNEATRLGASVGEAGLFANLTSTGDTANIWKESTCAFLVPAPPYNRIDFSIKADSTFRRGDSFVFNMTANFMFQSGTKDGIVCAKVSYTGDSTAVFYANVNVSGLSRLQIPANDDADIKEIDGFIYLGQGSDDSFTRKMLFIDGIQLIRFHRKKDDTAQPDSAAATNTAATAIQKMSAGNADTARLKPKNVGMKPQSEGLQPKSAKLKPLDSKKMRILAPSAQQ